MYCWHALRLNKEQANNALIWIVCKIKLLPHTTPKPLWTIWKGSSQLSAAKRNVAIEQALGGRSGPGKIQRKKINCTTSVFTDTFPLQEMFLSLAVPCKTGQITANTLLCPTKNYLSQNKIYSKQSLAEEKQHPYIELHHWPIDLELFIFHLWGWALAKQFIYN